MTTHTQDIADLARIAAERLIQLPADLDMGPACTLSTLRRVAEMVATAIEMAERELNETPPEYMTRPENPLAAMAGMYAVNAALFGMIEMAIAAE